MLTMTLANAYNRHLTGRGDLMLYNFSGTITYLITSYKHVHNNNNNMILSNGLD